MNARERTYRRSKAHNTQWATDSKGLFKGNTRVRVKDASTVQVLSHLFAKDSECVYYVMGVAKAVVDPESFEAMPDRVRPRAGEYEGACGYARDKFHVYFAYRMSGSPKILRKADRDTFQVLGKGRARDHQYVWAQDTLIKGADPATFELIDDVYSKDARRVYYDGAPLPGADPRAFRVIGKSTGADQSSVYRLREKLVGADPATYHCTDDDD